MLIHEYRSTYFSFGLRLSKALQISNFSSQDTTSDAGILYFAGTDVYSVLLKLVPQMGIYFRGLRQDSCGIQRR